MNLRDIFLAGAFAQGGGAVSPEQIDQAVNDYLDKNPVGVDLAMTGATVGQIAKITAVDSSGVPAAWEPVDLPSGGGGGDEWYDLLDITTEAETAAVHIYPPDGKRIKEIVIMVSTNSKGLVENQAIAIMGNSNSDGGTDYTANGCILTKTPGNVGTWSYPVFHIKSTPLLAVALATIGSVNANTVQPVYMGGSGQNSSVGGQPTNNGPWSVISVLAKFNADVRIVAKGVCV